jgi:putative phosphoribosyl transferase
MERFEDRRHAGRLLGARLRSMGALHPIVVGLPRGGVPVADEVARALGAPLDVILVRKLGVPTQPELAMGAIGEDGVRVMNPEIVGLTGVTERQIAAVVAHEQVELARRSAAYRAGRPRTALAGRTVIVVDDGVATGATTRAALAVARAHGAARVVLAVPVGADDTLRQLEHDGEEVVTLLRPADFAAVGQWYRDFEPTGDAEVVSLLAAAQNRATQQHPE